MELIVAVYDDWGIGRDGTQPVALKADRKFFRETTKGCLVIAGRRTVEDLAEKADRAMVIGGGSVYRQLLPYCDRAYVTKVGMKIPCDTFFPDLDQDPDWRLRQVLGKGEEDGIAYTFCLYERNR